MRTPVWRLSPSLPAAAGALLLLALTPLLLACDSDSRSPTDPPAVDPSKLRTCAEVTQALTLELAFIQQCSSAAQCGQELLGTSCGCTRNLVARLDADTRQFFAIVERGRQLRCPATDFGTICDCPAADGFACRASACAWNYL